MLCSRTRTTCGVISHESHMLGTFLKRKRVLVSFIPFPRFRSCKVPCVIKVSGSSWISTIRLQNALTKRCWRMAGAWAFLFNSVILLSCGRALHLLLKSHQTKVRWLGCEGRVGLWNSKCWKWMCMLLGRGRWRWVPLSRKGRKSSRGTHSVPWDALCKLSYVDFASFSPIKANVVLLLPLFPEPIQARLCKWDMNDQNGALKRQKVSLLLKGHFKGRIEEDSVLKFTFTLLQKIPRNI